MFFVSPDKMNMLNIKTFFYKLFVKIKVLCINKFIHLT